MEDGKPVSGSIFIYAPNKGAPIFFAVGFLASAILHAWQCRHYRSWRLTGLYVAASGIMAAGFIAREIAAFQYGNVNLYIATVCLVYTPPPLYELANYHALGRILYYVPHLAPIHPGRVLTTFGIISAVIEALNGNGAAYSANTSLPQSRQDMGHNLLKAALLLQVVVVSLFLLLAAIFHRRTCRAGIRTPAVSSALLTLYTSSALLLVRTIYRVVEYFSIADLHIREGMDASELSALLRYEWFFYVFEAVLMLANTCLLNARHPRRYLPSSTKTYLALDGVTEITGPGYKDRRPFWQTLVDPFDFHGLIRGRDQKTSEGEMGSDGAGTDAGARAPRNQARPAAKADLEAN